MTPYRKPFFGDPLFPFDINYKDIKSPQQELPDHLHDRFELVYVYAGKGTFFIDKTFYEKTPGDLFVIPGNTIHRSFPDPDDPIVSTAVFFAPALAQAGTFDEGYSGLRCFELARNRKSFKIELPDELRKPLETVLDGMEEELRLQRNGYRHAVRLLLQQLLLQVNRYAASAIPGDAGDRRIGPAWMQLALREIDEFPGRGIGLSELAERASVSPPHFSRVFKRLTGMNVTDYVNAKRIVLAKELLLETEDSVGLIAERCGFESLPHFHRVFKSLTGVTPAAYKREERKAPR
ncbi:helix-turn-helix domain-containing protein [Cohnella sp. CFH 77786]|uniref:AraC family transcriptional regulator n=1 Tax=Cohnella sp. CFH 77786 TaxID=2662265 RepID=UPI001C610737|nr:AraC family transcriptional regulator [Cohnella sp. CFH 77786]MBW5449086.1 helix-turn-helix domain-containing protein [Cohnella sp. CFH 77786]